MNIGFFVMTHQQEAKILERFGKFYRILQPGLAFKLPLFDEVSYHHSLKEQVIDIDGQTAITKDNVKIKIDGVLYFKITDPYKASYAVNKPVNAISLLAQTSMRSEIGKLVLDRTFEERDSLNSSIKMSLNQASEKWGIDCMRYEIKDIKPPEQIKRSMELQAESERIKRSKILSSEGEMRSKINIAEGIKAEQILDGEGQAQRILQEARSLCESLDSIGTAINQQHDLNKQSDLDISDIGSLKLRLSEQYLDAMAAILRKSNVLMTPPQSGSKNAFSPDQIAQAISTYKHIMGGENTGDLFEGGKSPSEQALAKIIAEVQDIKDQQRSGMDNRNANRGEQKYKYIDDKTLYSTDG